MGLPSRITTAICSLSFAGRHRYARIGSGGPVVPPPTRFLATFIVSTGRSRPLAPRNRPFSPPAHGPKAPRSSRCRRHHSHEGSGLIGEAAPVEGGRPRKRFGSMREAQRSTALTADESAQAPGTGGDPSSSSWAVRGRSSRRSQFFPASGGPGRHSWEIMNRNHSAVVRAAGVIVMLALAGSGAARGNPFTGRQFRAGSTRLAEVGRSSRRRWRFRFRCRRR